MKVALLISFLVGMSSYIDAQTQELTGDYPEYIEACVYTLNTQNTKGFNDIGCDEAQTLRYMNEVVDYPTY